MNADTTAVILGDLIAFSTLSRESNRALIEYCAAMLSDAGIDSRIIENDDGSRANLFASIGPADRPEVMLPAIRMSWRLTSRAGQGRQAKGTAGRLHS